MSRDLDDTGSAHPISRFLDALERDSTTSPTLRPGRWTPPRPPRSSPASPPTSPEIAELEARTLRHAETLGAPADLGVRSLTAWLSHQTRITRPEAARKVRLAHTLTTHPQTREAMARGEVHAEQALVIGQRCRRPRRRERRARRSGREAPHRPRGRVRRTRSRDPGSPGAGGRRPRPRRRARSQAPGRPGSPRAEEDRDAAVGRRRRPHPRPVHDPGRPGLDAPQSPASPGSTQARARHPRCRQLPPREADPGEVGAGVLRVHRALPPRPAPQDGRDERLGGGHR